MAAGSAVRVRDVEAVVEHGRCRFRTVERTRRSCCPVWVE